MKYSFLFICNFLISYNLDAYNRRSVHKLVNRTTGQKLEIANRDFRGAGSLLKGKDHSNLQLSGADFSPYPKSSKILGGFAGRATDPITITDLSGVKFLQSELVSAVFTFANLTGANLAGADITGANFTGANLTGVIGLESVIGLNTAIFCGAIMPDGTTCNTSVWQNKSGKLTIACNCPKSKK